MSQDVITIPIMTQADTPLIKLMTVNQAADFIGCSRTHVYRLIKSGALPTADVSRPGSLEPRHRILVDDLNDFITNSIKRS